MLSRVVRQILQATVYDVAIETPLKQLHELVKKLTITFDLNVKIYSLYFRSNCAVPITVLANFLKINSIEV